MLKNTFIFIFCLLSSIFFYFGYSQNVSLYQQYSGRYDFTFVGNTLNPDENTGYYPSYINTSSSALLNLQPTDVVEAAYLYWAGCGPGDFNIKLNGINIAPQRTFTTVQPGTSRSFFGAFLDVTSIVQAQGNGIYTVSDLDVNNQISTYWVNGTHFAGWAILVVYSDPNLPLNSVNIYDGFENLSRTTTGGIGTLTITLDNLNVIDDIGSKIGFIAWEGDAGIQVDESLKINSQLVDNPPLNPWNNAFNGTNSITGSNTLYNMDLDVYDIQNFIAIGDQSATIELTTGQDYVIINTIVTKLNNQLPDATITMEDYSTSCDSGQITVNYTVYNINSTEILPANTPVGFYIGTTLIGTTITQNPIAIGDNEQGSITLTLPAGTSETFTLIANVDYNNSVTELNETNNLFEMEIMQWLSPSFNTLENLTSCNIGFTQGIFDFSDYEDLVKTNSAHLVSFYHSMEDAENQENEIINTSNYEAQATPQTIFIRIENDLGCYSITSFDLLTQNCPPKVYNAVSANTDGYNDDFFIDGLRDIFVNFTLEIYNRWGRLLWTGNNNKPNWNGYVEDGVGGKNAPEGTYFYILHLNDPAYPEPLSGYLYLTY